MVKICSENVTPESHDTRIDESYGFTLSNFQRHAIEAIHTGNHVLITAHTGSGKTLPAEYAIEYFSIVVLMGINGGNCNLCSVRYRL